MIGGGVDGGGTHAVLDCPPQGWPAEVLELLAVRPRGTSVVAGVEAKVGREDGGVRIEVPGRALLHLQHDHARLTMPARAVERLGVEAWLDRWPSWASRLLLGRPLARPQLHAAGWRTGGLDVHVDTANTDPPDAWMVLADAWTGRSIRRRPRPDGYDARGRLTGVWLNSKADTARGRKAAVALHGYNKSLQQAESSRPSAALAKAHEDAGYRPELHGDVWRWEASLSGDALRLRSAEGDEPWNLEDPASWACKAAVAAAWAYVVGVPGARTSGVIRLTDERERDKPAKRRNAHPIWALLRTAAGSATRERLTQARAVVELELELRQERAEARVGRALGQLAGVVGAAETPQQAAGFAVSVVPKITRREDWAEHVSTGRIDHADLHEHEQSDSDSDSDKDEDNDDDN